MYKVIISTKSNLKKIAKLEGQQSKYRKSVTEVAEELSRAVKINTPVKKSSYSSGRKNGGSRISQPAGNLKKSIGVFDSKSQNYVRVWVGARVRDGFDGWYAQMVHGGHKIYNNVISNGKGGNAKNPLKRNRKKFFPEKTTGFVAPNPFITKSYTPMKSSLERKLKDKVGTDLETLIKQNSNV